MGRHERPIDGRQALELAQGGAQRGGHAGVERLGAGEHARATAMRGSEQRAGLRAQAPAQRDRVARRRGDAIELVQDEVGVVGLPQRARRRGGRGPLDARTLLEAIGEPGALQLARGAQPGEQVVRAAGAQRAAQQGDDPAPERGVPGDDRALQRVGDLERPEDLRQQRGVLARLAQDDRDVLGREALLGDQARDVRGDQLELGALAAALQQQQGVARIGRPARGGLEQRALERVQRRARVVLGERRQLDVLGPEGHELLEGLAAPRERRPAGLVGQGHRDRRAGVDGQRLDRVALDRREVVEAVQQHGRRAPARGLQAQRVERGLVVQDAIAALDRPQPVAVGAVQPGELLGVDRARRLALAPCPHGGPPAPGLDALLLELRDEAQQRLDEAGGARRRRERLEADPSDRSTGHALAGQAGERSAPHPGPARDLAHESREGHDAHPEDHAGPRQLAAVMVDVGERRHHENRIVIERGAVGAQHEAGLLGVGGTGDERERHGVPQVCSWPGGQGVAAGARASTVAPWALAIARCGARPARPATAAATRPSARRTPAGRRHARRAPRSPVVPARRACDRMGRGDGRAAGPPPRRAAASPPVPPLQR